MCGDLRFMRLAKHRICEIFESIFVLKIKLLLTYKILCQKWINDFYLKKNAKK
jgi:hypothetical protein